MRKCKSCLKKFPETAFHKTQSGHVRGVCKDCYNSGFRKVHTEPNDPVRKRQRLAAMKCRLMKKFGLTMEQFYEMEKSQNGVCKICHQPPTGRYTVLSVDHNHKTGKVRGLLCMRCNAELAWLEEHRKEALAYLDAE